jgi:hypothetical protein
VGRQDLAGLETDDRDLVLVDDGQDLATGVGHAGVEVVQAAGPAERELIEEFARAGAESTDGAVRR